MFDIIDAGFGLGAVMRDGGLIAVISLCVAFYSLGYMHGKHDSKTKK